MKVADTISRRYEGRLRSGKCLESKRFQRLGDLETAGSAASEGREAGLGEHATLP